MKNNLIFSLSLKSKKSLYKPFLFYTLSSLLPKVPLCTKIKFLSFKSLFLNQIPSGEIIVDQGFLVRTQVLCVNNSFLYLNLGKKFTLIKPKFKSIFTQLISKEFLFLSHKSLFKNLGFLEIRMLFQVCQFLLFNKISEFFTSLSVRSFNFSSLKKLSGFSIKYSNKFFFFKKSINLFSNFQKKINFFQFNVLLKKYKYIF